MNFRIGLDLVSVDAVADAIATHGDRYLERTYTAEELSDCGGEPHRLAARFAAKEALMKALDRGDEAMPWTSISVSRDPSGRPVLSLTGETAALAEARGVQSLQVSLTHDGAYSAAVVLAVLG
jgi:holo-[acyl-carrier protein] synthase